MSGGRAFHYLFVVLNRKLFYTVHSLSIVVERRCHGFLYDHKKL